MVSGGLALAVPSNAVERFLRGMAGQKPFLGVTTRAVEVNVDGAAAVGLLVLEVAAGSPAEAAGLLIGDVLVGAGPRGGDSPIFRSADDLGGALFEADPGDVLDLDVVRAGQRITRRVVLAGAGSGEAQAA
jgi:serine protease Do